MKSVISLTSTVIAVALTHLVKSSTALPSGYDLQRRAAPAGTGYTCSQNNVAGRTEITVQWTELLKKADLGDSDIRVVVKSSDTSKPDWLRIDHTDEKASDYDSVFLQTYKSYTPANGTPESTSVSLKKQGDTNKKEKELVNVPRPMNRENEKIFVSVESTKPGVLPLTTIEFTLKDCLAGQ